ncbi:hypothetical protein JCM19992_11230 [Thermostilla marina]
MISEKLREELYELLGALVDDRITPGEHQRLEQILLSSAEARKIYLDYLEMNSGIYRWALEEREVEPLEKLHDELEKVVEHRRPPAWRRMVVGAAAVAVVLVSLVLWGSGFLGRSTNAQSQADEPAVPEYVATVLQTQGAVWELPTPDCRDGWRLTAGVMRLEAGLAEIVFDHGARVVMEGPAEVEICDADHVDIKEGRIVVHAVDVDGPFRVDVPQAMLLPREAEFGVELDPSGDCRLQVFEGTVQRSWIHDAIPESERLDTLVAGDARSWSGAGERAVALAPDRFVRRIAPGAYTSDSTASLLARESFGTYLTHHLDDSAEGWQSSWSIERGGRELVNPEGVIMRTVSDQPVGQGVLDVVGDLRMHRRLADAVSLNETGVYYWAWLLQAGSFAAGQECEVELTLHDALSSDADDAVVVRLSPGTHTIAVRCGKDRVAQAFPFRPAESYLVVAKLMTGKGKLPEQLFVRVFLPEESVDPVEPLHWTLTTQGAAVDGRLDTVSIDVRSAVPVKLDEFRLADRWRVAAAPWIQPVEVPPEFTAGLLR